MVWQDIVLFVTTFLFAYALVPQVMKGYKEKKTLITIQTSIINWISLYVVAFTLYTLGLYFSTIMTIITGSLWGLMFFQSIKYR